MASLIPRPLIQHVYIKRSALGLVGSGTETRQWHHPRRTSHSTAALSVLPLTCTFCSSNSSFLRAVSAVFSFFDVSANLSWASVRRSCISAAFARESFVTWEGEGEGEGGEEGGGRGRGRGREGEGEEGKGVVGGGGGRGRGEGEAARE